MNTLRAFTWVALLSGALSSVSPAQPAPKADAFLAWAKANAPSRTLEGASRTR